MCIGNVRDPEKTRGGPGPRTRLCSSAAPLIPRRFRGLFRRRGLTARHPPRRDPAPEEARAAAPRQAGGNPLGASLAALRDLALPG